jgi:hypothetical protein
MTTVDRRPTQRTCPNWCERRHAAGDVDPEDHRGLQWSPALVDDGYWVDVPTVQNTDGDVVVWVKAVEA